MTRRIVPSGLKPLAGSAGSALSLVFTPVAVGVRGANTVVEGAAVEGGIVIRIDVTGNRRQQRFTRARSAVDLVRGDTRAAVVRRGPRKVSGLGVLLSDENWRAREVRYQL